MTTQASKTKTAPKQQPLAAPEPKDLEMARQIHVLAHGIYRHLAHTQPWVTTSAPNLFSEPAHWPPTAPIGPMYGWGTPPPLGPVITEMSTSRGACHGSRSTTNPGVRSMFTSDPTLYGATLPHRDVPFVNPFYGQWPQQPWSTYFRYFPPFPDFQPQGQFNLPYTQPFYGNKMIPQLPYAPYMPTYYGSLGAYNLPQFRWQFPIA